MGACSAPGAKPAVIRVNYGVQRSQNGGTAARTICMLPLVTGSWKRQGGGLLLSTSGSFPFNAKRLEMPELMAQPTRIVNMNRLGWALNKLGTQAGEGPPVKALFVYNCNAAAVAPDQNAVLRGLRRADLFTVVHEQFFTDTADYADILLPAPTFLETKDVQGAYGHLFAQVSLQAIQPLGEVRSNVRVFGELGLRMFGDACFSDSVDELIDQALAADGEDPRFAGITRERLEREGHAELTLAGPLPFADASWFRTPSGRGELLPVPEYRAPVESRGGDGSVYPLEFLPRKADNYMNSTFANQPGHALLEAGLAGMLEMHPVDAALRAVGDGDAVEIFNARGRMQLCARLSDKVGQGVVASRLDWSKLGSDLSGNGSNVNALTGDRLTDLGGGATFYSTLVEVRKVQVESVLLDRQGQQQMPAG